MSDEDKRTCWWREAIVYQIWPKSFYSGRGTPTGDIAGIIAKLDYLKSLGINTIWLSPHYASPMIDEGYDISDYEDINPIFGTVQDTEHLIKECHSRGLRIIFDLVINHTSDQHKWFLESRSSKENPKRDWYIWRPARYVDGKRMPPTNWESAFSQSTWEWDEKTEEYYLHMFAVEQPDLNWRNTDCRSAILKSSMEFWLERGLDGFRVDTCSLYAKPEQLVDAPITKPGYLQTAWDLIVDGERIHEYLGMMGKLLAKYDAMTVGELSRLPNKEVLKYISFARNELSMVFAPDVALVGMDGQEGHFKTAPWNVAQIATNTEKLQTLFDDNDGWTTSFLENHDLGRSVSRFASHAEKHHADACKMLSLYTTLLSGTPFYYQGQEIGMTNVPLEWDLSEYLDIATVNFIKALRESGKSDKDIEKFKPNINLLARDNARTPVQWTDGPNAGFTKEGVKPWMRVNDNFKTINVASQIDDPNSILNFYRKAIELRKKYPALFVYGKYSNALDYSDPKSDEKVFAFVKGLRKDASADGQKRAIVLLNFSDQEQGVKITGLESGKVALSSHDEVKPDALLQPYEGRVLLFSN
ncbi:maltase malt, partial [Meira miltonrushii]